MPDANKNFALNSIVGAAFGAAGQRCMALSTRTSSSLLLADVFRRIILSSVFPVSSRHYRRVERLDS